MDRQYSRTGLGEDTDVVEREELTAVQDTASFRRTRASAASMASSARRPRVVDVDADRGGFTVQRSQPDGDHLQPSPRQDADRCQLFGKYNRVLVRQQQHRRAPQCDQVTPATKDRSASGSATPSSAAPRTSRGSLTGTARDAPERGRIRSQRFGMLRDSDHSIRVATVSRRVVQDREFHRACTVT